MNNAIENICIDMYGHIFKNIICVSVILLEMHAVFYTSHYALVFFVLFKSALTFYIRETCLWKFKLTKMRAVSTVICFLYVFLLISRQSFCNKNEDKFLSGKNALERRLFGKLCHSERRYKGCGSDVSAAGGNSQMNRCVLLALQGKDTFIWKISMMKLFKRWSLH